MRRILSTTGLLVFVLLMTVLLTAAAPMPVTTFTLVAGLPATMTVGESYTVVVDVTSDQVFNSAQVLPDLQFPGKGVVAKGGDHAGRGMTARLEVTFTAKTSTAKMPNGVAPVAVVVGVRYGGGYVAVQRYEFNVKVP